MASHRSSSSKKRKSSKRKSSKVPSEDRHKKRSKKTKSRKLRHSDESSYSSDDSVSVSTSSSEDEYSRSRSRTTSKVKEGKKKRSERSSSKHRSSKKKKRSRRSVDSDERKKTRKKKGRRKLSVSSVSSDSQGGSSSGESDLPTRRGRSRGKVKDDKDTEKLKSGVRRDESRSLSRSPDGRYSKSNDLSGGVTLPADNTSRRLRSVIAVVKGHEIEVEEGDKGGHKEEIAYDHDEYPPSKSNDSYDYVSKKEFSHQSEVELESRRVELSIGEETLESNSNAKLTGDRDDKFHSGGGRSSIEENKGEVSSPMPSSTADDLESILRLKALENLKKYRGGAQKPNPPVDATKNNASDVKQLSAANIEFASNKSRDMHVSGVAGATRLPDRNPSPVVRRSSALPEGKVQHEKGRAIVSGSVNRPPSRVSISDNSKKSELPITGKPDISSSTPRRESSRTHAENKLVTESTAGEDVPEPPLRVDQASDKINSRNNDSPRPSSASEPPTLLKSTLEEESSKEPPGEEDKEGSQFQQKTMSVVRGSETVQVSYKVYIPKKTPALARRLLRR